MNEYSILEDPSALSTVLANAINIDDVGEPYPPYMDIPDKLQIQMTFPFRGAAVRFRARLKGCTHSISVYLDTGNTLGYYGDGGSYWEAYPINDETYRCDINDVDELMKVIVGELEK